MGAAASVQLVYQDATKWFRQYFDAETYIADFQSIDKDSDGAIRLQDLEKWIQEKAATEGGGWKHFIHNPQIYTMAHEHASKYMNANSKLFLVKKKIVDLPQFRALLVQLFAISILWLHFKRADEFLMGNDAYNCLLNRVEFKLGVKSFCAGYGHEEISDEQLDEDFDVLDKDKSGNISFTEICNFCCKFIDPAYANIPSVVLDASSQSEKQGSMKGSLVDSLIHESNKYSQGETFFPVQVIEELKSKSTTDELDTVTRSSMKRRSVVPLTANQAGEAFNDAVESLVAEVEKNHMIQQFEELKLATELSLFEQGIDASKKLGSVQEGEGGMEESKKTTEGQ